MYRLCYYWGFRITVEFVVFTGFFEIKINKQEEYMWDFFGYIFPDLHTQLKVLFLLASIFLITIILLKFLTKYFFCPSIWFVNLPRSIFSLSPLSNTRDVTERMPSFTGISPCVRILSGIKGINRGKDDLRDDVVSNDREVEWETDTGWI